MDLNHHTKPANLLRYSFLWNEARLVIAALSLIFGAEPILSRILPSSGYGLWTLATFISGLAAAYLLYAWNKGGQKLFGKKDRADLIAFMIATLSGLHLAYAGLLGTNLIMAYTPYSLLSTVIYLGAALYLWSAWHLHKRYKENGEKLF